MAQLFKDTALTRLTIGPGEEDRGRDLFPLPQELFAIKPEEIDLVIFNTMPMACLLLDYNDHIRKINPALEKLLGFRSSDLIGTSLQSLITPSDRELLQGHFDKCLQKNRGVSTELRMITANRNELIVQLLSVVLIAQSPLVLTLVKDITETRILEEKISSLDSLNLLGEMVAGMAHEVRNPLTTVKGFLQILSTKEMPESQREYFELMIAELDRANSLITQFLSITKKSVANKTRCNLNSIIESIFPLLQAEALQSDHNIVLDMSLIPDLLLDEKKIRQIIMNLAKNGLDAMSAGGTLFLKTFREHQEVVLAVRDEGHGIPPHLVQNLGKPFLTTKENGTGLGLAICHKLANLHNAIISVETGSAGTTFYVRFKASPVS